MSCLHSRPRISIDIFGADLHGADPPGGLVAGPIYNYLANDHRRLEEALQRATATGEVIEAQEYSKFRAGLLRHIGMEEKIHLLQSSPPARPYRERDTI